MPAAKPSSPRLRRSHPLAAGGVYLGLPLAEGSGKLSSDLSGNGRDATLSAPSLWRGGQSGSAVLCSGGANFTVPFPAIISGVTGGVFTFILTFFPVSWTGAFTALFDDSGRQYSLFIDTSGNISFAGSVFTPMNTKTLALTAGNWWHLAFVGNDNLTNLAYVNGVQKASAVAAGAGSASTVHFGDNPSGGGSNANVIYDSILFLPRVLSQAEVAQHFQDSFALYRPRPSVFAATPAVAAQNPYDLPHAPQHQAVMAQ